MAKHKSILDTIKTKKYASVLQSEYKHETDCSFFTISINNIVHDMEVYYYTDGMYSYYVDSNYKGTTYNINDLTSWF